MPGTASELLCHPETGPYWRASSEGRLLIKTCADCGEAHFYPRSMCPHCFSPNTAWKQSAGTGRVYSFSVMRRAETPYAIAYVTLDEGVVMLTNLIEFDLDRIRIGDRVQVAFTEKGDRTLPVFRPAG